jgi:cellulose synthase/poly-beta-1,6-N-acetylglucosamine synthase-like glycosyltransferase
MEALALAVIALVATIPALYLSLLAALSLQRRTSSPLARAHRLAVLIPAHNEAGTIGTLLSALTAQDYPPTQVIVHVVADNCSDRTAEIARTHGAVVHERTEQARPGKGAALNWLTKRVLDQAPDVDAFVFLDADSRVEPTFLAALSGALAGGARLVQALNLVEDTSWRPLSVLRIVSFHLFCELRLTAYERLSGSAGLRGNGMCIGRELLIGRSWDEDGVVEDIGFNLRLLDEGERVIFAPGALVRSLMPDRLNDALGQTTRWERGKFDLFAPACRVLAHGVALRDRARIVAAVDVLLPPMSVLVAATGLGMLAGLVGGSTPLVALSTISIVAFGGYVSRGIVLANISPIRLCRALVFAPAFVGWKLWVMARVAYGSGRGEWVRSTRAVRAGKTAAGSTGDVN